MNYDKPLLAAALGIASTIPYEITTRVLLFIGMGKYSFYELDSLIVSSNRPSEFLGFIVSSIVGGALAVILYYATKKIGKDYLVLKGIAISLLFGLILEVLFMATIEGKSIPLRPMSDYYTHAFGAVIFGITLGILFKIFLFKKPIFN
ncbi:MAG: hypothetical protein A4E53_02469 [Pelotomaculum sp. PtaB.Bin104]|nr:MAG: hypothetical protein A4E53_02469 [Pelotomaculum sp. PtaB.Bin104]